MKNQIILLLTLFLWTGIISESIAQPGRRRPGHAAPRRAERIHAKRVLRRSAVVIHHAQKVVKENKVYTGNLAKSIAHQRYARKLYFEGKYLRAMHQSRRARRLAIMAIEANKGSIPAGTSYEKEDEDLMNESPVSDADLDKELDQNMPGYSTKDEDFVDAALSEIDLSDME